MDSDWKNDFNKSQDIWSQTCRAHWQISLCITTLSIDSTLLNKLDLITKMQNIWKNYICRRAFKVFYKYAIKHVHLLEYFFM